MKKVLGLLAITGFVACSNGENAAPAADTAKKADTVVPTVVDTTTKMVDTAKKMVDTANKKMEEAGKKVEEAGKKVKEASKKVEEAKH